MSTLRTSSGLRNVSASSSETEKKPSVPEWMLKFQKIGLKGDDNASVQSAPKSPVKQNQAIFEPPKPVSPSPLAQLEEQLAGGLRRPNTGFFVFIIVCILFFDAGDLPAQDPDRCACWPCFLFLRTLPLLSPSPCTQEM